MSKDVRFVYIVLIFSGLSLPDTQTTKDYQQRGTGFHDKAKVCTLKRAQKYGSSYRAQNDQAISARYAFQTEIQAEKLLRWRQLSADFGVVNVD